MQQINKFLLTTLFSSSLLFGSGGHNSHWGYTGHEGPSNWGDLSEKYQMCKLGSSQSPINISKSVIVKTDNMKEINFNYHTQTTEVLNNGHTIQVNVESGSTINIDDKSFELKQFHFHTPSENEIDGKSFPLEAHFVHVSSDGEIAVVGVLFEYGRHNYTINKIWNKMPSARGDDEEIELPASHIKLLLPYDKSYYRFSGSLTTPPCSEGVRWFVLQNYAKVSKYQVQKFLSIMKHENNRPIQAINARKVMQ